MRLLIVNTDYPPFLRRHYTAQPHLAAESYDRQMQARMASGFGVADAYSDALLRLGHAAADIHANNVFAQYAWAREHAPHLVRHIPAPEPTSARIPWSCNLADASAWLAQVLIEQVRQFRPDGLLNQAMDGIHPEVLCALRPHVRLIIGQHASPKLDESLDFSVYDLCISSFPATLDFFRRRGNRVALSRLAFDGRLLARLPQTPRDLPLTFIGSFYDMHRSRTALLERVAERFPLKVWGPEPRGGFGASPLRNCYQGEAWGLEMLTLLRRSRLTLNHHGDVPPFANNFRLYEATGAGALLITDWKANLHEMFDPEREVVAYRDENECLALIERYLNDEPAARAIADAGQQRTLRDHTFLDRMRRLAGILEPLIDAPQASQSRRRAG